jgi:hypothetical protein
MPETVNILLSHGDFPDMFDRVAELGIDLMLAGILMAASCRSILWKSIWSCATSTGIF